MTTYGNYCAIRDAQGLTDYKVAKLAGVGSSMFVDWRTGRSAPKLERLRKIAAALNVDVYELIKDTEKEPA